MKSVLFNFSIFAESDLKEMFTRKAVISSHTPQDSPVNQKRPVSLLTRLVQQYPDGVNNPFIEYSKFDGTVSCDVFVYVLYY